METIGQKEVSVIMKVWIERFKNEFFIHLSEPTHVEGDAGWFSKGCDFEFYPTATERKELRRNIEEGQVAELELKKCWEPCGD